MTDRLMGFTVTLDRDIREDDAEIIKQAISALRYVLSVDPVVASFRDEMIRNRVRFELRDKLLAVLGERGS